MTCLPCLCSHLSTLAGHPVPRGVQKDSDWCSWLSAEGQVTSFSNVLAHFEDFHNRVWYPVTRYWTFLVGTVRFRYQSQNSWMCQFDSLGSTRTINMMGVETALVRCLGREISFSVLKNSLCVLRNLLFSTNFIESEFLQSCFIMHFCSFCVIKYRPTLMKNKVWVYRCCVMYFFLFKHQNTAENDHFYAVNSQVATLVVFTAGM